MGAYIKSSCIFHCETTYLDKHFLTMSTSEEILGLERLLLNKDVSAEEYFTIVVSSTDLKNAKFSIRNVIDKLKNSNDRKNHDSLQKLYKDFFQSKDAVEPKTNTTADHQNPIQANKK